MPEIQHTIYLVTEEISEEAKFVNPILYPEIGLLLKANSASNSERGTVCSEVSKLLSKLSPDEFHRRIPTGTPEIETLSVTVPPAKLPELRLRWRSDFELHFPTIFWNSEDGYWLGIIPSLSITVLRNSKNKNQFLEEVKEEISQTLIRTEKAKSIRELVWLTRHETAELTPVTFTTAIPSPLEVSKFGEEKVDPEATLREVATRLGYDPRAHKYEIAKKGYYQEVNVYQRDDELKKIAKLLSTTPNKSVLIVGPDGVGKTSLFRHFVRFSHSFGIQGMEFWETSGTRIVAGISGFGQWQQRCQDLVGELEKKNAVLHLGNLSELLSVGKSAHQSQSIGAYFRPEIESGRFRAFAECSDNQFKKIEKEEPELLEAFDVLRLEKPDDNQLEQILKEVAIEFGRRNGSSVSDEVISDLIRLHKRFFAYSAVPGKSVQFIRDLMLEQPRNTVVELNDLWTRFETQSGLPRFLLDPNKKLDVSKTENWFSGRVVGQQLATKQVTEMFAKVKANLTTSQKPIASFLFIGPTGVGKTETAKSIASFMFNDSNRMIRIDMSEYQDEISIQRLIGSIGKKDGLLTSQVRQNPFSVILFDEFEKAHPAFFDLLLQILGEGRLTDIQGRVADFTTSIVVMTSNLGVSNFKTQSLGFGNQSSGSDRFRSHFSKEVQKFLKPELYNRIDSIVPFTPLEQEAVESIVHAELVKLTEREGIRFRNLDFHFDPEVVRWIAANGNDTQFGARPLQRFIQQNVVIPVSEKLNDYREDIRLTADLSVVDEKISVDVKAVPLKRNEVSQTGIESALSELQHQRRRAQRLANCHPVIRIQNDVYQAERSLRKQLLIEKRTKKRNHLKIASLEVLIKHHSKVLAGVSENYKNATSIEDQMLMSFGNNDIAGTDRLKEESEKLKNQTDLQLMNLFLHDNQGSDRIGMILCSRDLNLAWKMVTAYSNIAKERKFSTKHFVIKRPSSDPFNQDWKKFVSHFKNLKVDSDTGPEYEVYHLNPEVNLPLPTNIVGFSLQIEGSACFPVFMHEKGVHLFSPRVFIDTFGGSWDNYRLPAGTDLSGRFQDYQLRRKYNSEIGSANDSRLKRGFPFNLEELDQSMRNLIDENLKVTIQSYLDQN